jgi:4-carboxymuconolactone decarboxylase
MSDRRFGPLPRDEMTDDQRAVADAILAGPRGSNTGLRGPFEALLRNPDLADAAQRLGEHVRFRSALPRHLNELAILVIGAHWHAAFEVYAHRRLAVEAGLDPAVADAAAGGERPALDSDAAAVYDFAAQLVTDGDVTDDAFAAVADRFGLEGAIDLIATVGYYTVVSFVLNVDRYPVPE